MSDLDVRVAALVQAEIAIANLLSYQSSPNKPTIHEYGQARRTLETIRAELQKPALHEPVTDAELKHALDVFSADEISIAHGWRKAIESVLQGRAKPAQEEITDAELIAIADKCGTLKGVNLIGFARKVIRASKGEKT